MGGGTHQVLGLPGGGAHQLLGSQLYQEVELTRLHWVGGGATSCLHMSIMKRGWSLYAVYLIFSTTL